MAEDTSSSESDEDLKDIIPSQNLNAKPPVVPKKANNIKPAIRFTEAKRDEAEDDFVIDEDSENGEDSE